MILSFLLLICLTAKGQNTLPTASILKGDTITLEIKKSGCYVHYESIYRFSKKSDSLIEVDFQSYHPKEYYYKKNEVAKYHRDSTKLFLKRNNIKLKHYYYVSQKPRETIIGNSYGLSCFIISEFALDSINYYPLSILSEIDALYDKVMSDKLQTKLFAIAGDWTTFNLYSINTIPNNSYITEKRIQGWYDFQISTTKTK